MPQAVTTTIVGAFLAFAFVPYAPGESATVVGSLAQARRLVEAKDYSSAMTVLEDLLIDAEGSEKPAITGLLKECYSELARQAEAAGKDRDAAHYRDNIAILDAPPLASDSRAPTQTPPKPASGPKPARLDDRVAAKTKARVKTVASTPPLLSEGLGVRDLALEPAPGPDPVKSPAPEPARSRSPQPTSSVPTKPEPVRTASSGSPTSDLIESVSDPSEATSKQESAPSADATSASSSAKPPAATPRAIARSVSEPADRLFVAKKYSDAGRLYAALAREKRLPAERTNHWAYCRMVDVTQRINSHPRSAQEWDEIEAEIQSIQLLAPKLWYGEYLRSVATEARRGLPRSQGRAGNLVVRGSAPDETETPSRDKRSRVAKASTDAMAFAPSKPPQDRKLVRAKGESKKAVNSTWQVHETTNFRIFHCDSALAEQAAAAAERVRAEQGQQWKSPALAHPWAPRCDLYLYPDGPSLARATGQPETAPGFSTLMSDGSRITTRRTVLRADHPQLLTAVLPHEITHVVLADLFAVQQIPRWADEGIAVLAEPEPEQKLRAADLHESLESGQTLDVVKLMTSDEPNAKDWSLYYAESVSLTRFLVERDSPERFIQFLRAASGKGIDAGLRDVYQIKSLTDLRNQWTAYARQQISNR
jgi:hypothetical protein